MENIGPDKDKIVGAFILGTLTCANQTGKLERYMMR